MPESIADDEQRSSAPKATGRTLRIKFEVPLAPHGAWLESAEGTAFTEGQAGRSHRRCALDDDDDHNARARSARDPVAPGPVPGRCGPRPSTP